MYIFANIKNSLTKYKEAAMNPYIIEEFDNGLLVFKINRPEKEMP